MSSRVLYRDDRVQITLAGRWALADRRGHRTDQAHLDDPTDLARFARWNLPPGLNRHDFRAATDAYRAATESERHAT